MPYLLLPRHQQASKKHLLPELFEYGTVFDAEKGRLLVEKEEALHEMKTINRIRKKNLVTAVRKGAAKEDVASMVLVNPSPELNLDLTEKEAEEIKNRNKSTKDISKEMRLIKTLFPQKETTSADTNKNKNNSKPNSKVGSSRKKPRKDYDANVEYIHYVETTPMPYKVNYPTYTNNGYGDEPANYIESLAMGEEPSYYQEHTFYPGQQYGNNAQYDNKNNINYAQPTNKPFENTGLSNDKSNGNTWYNSGTAQDSTAQFVKGKAENTYGDSNPADSNSALQSTNTKETGEMSDTIDAKSLAAGVSKKKKEEEVFLGSNEDVFGGEKKNDSDAEDDKINNEIADYKPTNIIGEDRQSDSRPTNLMEEGKQNVNLEIGDKPTNIMDGNIGNADGAAVSKPHNNVEQKADSNEVEANVIPNRSSDKSIPENIQSFSNNPEAADAKTFEGEGKKGAESNINGVGAVTQTYELHSGNGKEHVSYHPSMHDTYANVFSGKLSDKIKSHHLKPMFGGRDEITNISTNNSSIADASEPRLKFRNLTGMQNVTTLLGNAGTELAEIYNKVHRIESINSEQTSEAITSKEIGEMLPTPYRTIIENGEQSNPQPLNVTPNNQDIFSYANTTENAGPSVFEMDAEDKSDLQHEKNNSLLNTIISDIQTPFDEKQYFQLNNGNKQNNEENEENENIPANKQIEGEQTNSYTDSEPNDELKHNVENNDIVQSKSSHALTQGKENSETVQTGPNNAVKEGKESNESVGGIQNNYPAEGLLTNRPLQSRDNNALQEKNNALQENNKLVVIGGKNESVEKEKNHFILGIEQIKAQLLSRNDNDLVKSVHKNEQVKSETNNVATEPKQNNDQIETRKSNDQTENKQIDKIIQIKQYNEQKESKQSNEPANIPQDSLTKEHKQKTVPEENKQNNEVTVNEKILQHKKQDNMGVETIKNSKDVEGKQAVAKDSQNNGLNKQNKQIEYVHINRDIASKGNNDVRVSEQDNNTERNITVQDDKKPENK